MFTADIDTSRLNVLMAQFAKESRKETDEIIKKKPKKLILIEKDNHLCEFLKNKYNKNENILIFNKDILKFDLRKHLEKDTIIFEN